ncbi:hypothetical protein PL78_15050 [Yersinia entomophaga]|uniref:MaoC-like domain-containing protein n=1 Tax=Yersinia entomophaga TaxID=935293 RepID=A0ABN4PZX3_YERET|nr:MULTISPECIES: MaoC/PaaZ C-terminal domain-containing protein [Yersinia]ANI31131.1 hypothetical protein PL78_15050 [Yersinia entomophaga]OWF86337.1 hypothetical protein B4914_15105 [Yersinia entomophaga]
MKLYFDEQAIADWADYSGDYNPIHFSLSHAQAMGSANIVAHGMLALMHIQHRLSLDDIQPNQDWVAIKTLFRSPVLQKLHYELAIKKKNQRDYFLLFSEDRSCEAITGSRYKTHPMEKITEYSPEDVLIEHSLYEEKKALFETTYPYFDSAWLFMDSLVFTRFSQSEFLFVNICHLLNNPQIKQQSDLFAELRVLQTTHRVLVAPDFFKVKISGLDSSLNIRFRLCQPIMISSSQNIISSLFQLKVIINGQFVMQSDIGIQIQSK